MGPAFVAAVAYVDPGNVAANLSAGAGYGYLLVWVLVVANVMAMLVQYLSAKLGLVTGHSLPELVGDALPRRSSRLAFWFQAELVAAATDLAEVIGGAVALEMLFGLPLLVGGLITGALSLAILAIPSRHGQRTFEIVIIGMLVVVAIGFTAGLAFSPPVVERNCLRHDPEVRRHRNGHVGHIDAGRHRHATRGVHALLTGARSSRGE